MTTSTGNYRILSLDGGGIRGVLTARLLEAIETKRPGFLESVDLFAGTSTGAILATTLAMGKPPATIVQLYREQGPAIFRARIKSSIPFLSMLFFAKYGTKPRYDALHSVIGDLTLGEIKKGLFISTFLLDDDNDPKPKPLGPKPRSRWKAKFFHNFAPASGGADYRPLKALDVVMRSSAAPLYFPIYQNYIDGGVVANNPSVCALSQVLDAKTPLAESKSVVVLSLGTGDNPECITSKEGDWGLWQWKLQLIDILTSAASGLADYQCYQLLNERYCRLNPDLPDAIGLDDIGRIPDLIAAAEQAAQGPEFIDVLHFIDNIWLPPAPTTAPTRA